MMYIKLPSSSAENKDLQMLVWCLMKSLLFRKHPGASIELKDWKATITVFMWFLSSIQSYYRTENALFYPILFAECGGKMHLREGEFEKAHTDFFEAFKNYDESGSPRRTTCLKYLVLANMLMKSGINPFDSQEVCVCSKYSFLSAIFCGSKC